MGLLGLSEHTPKGLWSRKSEYEYVNMTLTTLGYRNQSRSLQNVNGAIGNEGIGWEVSVDGG